MPKGQDAVEYRLTRHASDVLEKRGILRGWMERVLREPQRIEPDSMDPGVEHRLGRVAEAGGKVLHVVVNVGSHPPRVISVYFDRRKRIP